MLGMYCMTVLSALGEQIVGKCIRYQRETPNNGLVHHGNIIGIINKVRAHEEDQVYKGNGVNSLRVSSPLGNERHEKKKRNAKPANDQLCVYTLFFPLELSDLSFTVCPICFSIVRTAFIFLFHSSLSSLFTLCLCLPASPYIVRMSVNRSC